MLRLKCTKFDFGWGSAPDPARGAYSAPQTLAGFKGLLLREGREGERGRAKRYWKRKGRGRDGRGICLLLNLGLVTPLVNIISPGACFCADMELETCPQTFQAVDVDRYVDPEAKWQTGFWMQYSTLTRRNFRRQRKRYFSKLLWGQMLFLAFATGLIWFGMPRTENTALDRLGLVI